MKTIKSIITTVIAVLTFASIFSACQKTEESTSQKLSLHLHSMVGNSDAAYATQYQDASGRKFNISDMRYYISNIVLIKNDGSEYPIDGKVILANPATQEYELATVPVGTYKGFKFVLGLDSLTNHADPTVYPASNPLAIQSPAIHWSWNSGYIFMKVEGRVDTTANNNGTLDFEYFYHIGMDAMKRTIDFSTKSFTVSSGSDHEIEMHFDLLEVLSNVDMRTENITHTMGNMPLATKIANNWQSAFSVM